MKNLFGGAKRCKGKLFPAQQLFHGAIRNAALFFYSMVLLTFLFTACKKQDIEEPANDVQSETDHAMNTEQGFHSNYNRLGWRTLWELWQARIATAKYRHIGNAIRDGYADISVVVPNMGYHYMKSTLVDSVFDFRKPEILVYNKKHNGRFELVAVEYAVPIDQSPGEAPEGFTGSSDVWDHNTGFGLWLLHAWIWAYNPDGVFNPTNPLVHLH